MNKKTLSLAAWLIGCYISVTHSIIILINGAALVIILHVVHLQMCQGQNYSSVYFHRIMHLSVT